MNDIPGVGARHRAADAGGYECVNVPARVPGMYELSSCIQCYAATLSN
jgi:hypothetical protein